jgi:hypothetical protein
VQILARVKAIFLTLSEVFFFPDIFVAVVWLNAPGLLVLLCFARGRVNLNVINFQAEAHRKHQ